METFLKTILIAFVFFDLGVWAATSRQIRNKWPWFVIIPGGAIYYKLFPPNIKKGLS